MEKFNASTYRISTITATGSIKTEVFLDVLYRMLAEHTPKEISYLEYGANKHELQSIGVKSTKTKNTNKNKEEKKRRFDNQLTIVMFYMDNKYNIKLFKNGNVQITGVKSIDKGNDTINFLIEIIRNIYTRYNKGVIKSIDTLMNSDYRIRLINSDFKINFEIRLDHLYNIATKKYNITCSYEPCIYPGAKIEYYYPNNGYCKCKTFCNGKSDVCKKITIAVFQSGCVIITGANKIEHIEVAYAFICKMLKDNMKEIKRNKLVLPIPTKEIKK